VTGTVCLSLQYCKDGFFVIPSTKNFVCLSLQYCKDGFFVIPSTKNFENLIKLTAAKVTAAVNLSVILKPFIKIELLGFYKPHINEYSFMI